MMHWFKSDDRWVESSLREDNLEYILGELIFDRTKLTVVQANSLSAEILALIQKVV